MLLFVMQPDLKDRNKLGQVACRFDQPHDRAIDMAAIRGDLIGARARYQAARRRGLAWTGRQIIRIEEIGEALIEDAIIFGGGAEKKLFKKPADMGAMPFGWACVRNGLNALVFG